MQLLNQLEDLGLSPSESKVYLYLLENGVSSPPEIAKGTGIALTNSYHLLSSLKEHRLIGEQRKGKRKTYLANDPSALVARIDKRKQAAETLLPDLRALYKTQKNKPSIKFYDGWSQVKEIYLQATKATEVWAMGSTEDLSSIDPKFWQHFLSELRKNKVYFYDLLPHTTKDSSAKEMVSQLDIFYKIKFLPDKYKTVPTDLVIWDDNVAIISLESPTFGTVITSPHFVYTFKILLELARKNTSS